MPVGSVIKNPPSRVGDTGSIPGPGRFHVRPQSDEARALQLLNLCSRTRSHNCSGPVLQPLTSMHPRAPASHQGGCPARRGPPTSTREKPPQQQRPSTAINKYKSIKKLKSHKEGVFWQLYSWQVISIQNMHTEEPPWWSSD